jgi:NitT/TauT family transport system permease protein
VRRLLHSRWFSLLALLPGAALWQLLGMLEISYFLPPLTSVLEAVVEVITSERFADALSDSLIALATGFGIAVVSGVVIGILMGHFKQVYWALNPYVNLFMSAPKAALIPVFVMVLGFGRPAIVLGVILYSFFPIAVNTLAGVQGTSRSMLDMARSLGASEAQVLRHVVLPSAAPMILGGLRLGSGRAVKGLIIGEQLVAVVGLGALVQRYGVTFQVERLYAMILLIGFAGVVVVSTMQLIERRSLPWLERQRGLNRPLGGGGEA